MIILNSLFIQKGFAYKKSTATPYTLAKVLNSFFIDYNQITNKKINLFISPGYLGTNQNTREDMITNVLRNSQGINLIQNISILNTMGIVNSHRTQFMNELSGKGFNIYNLKLTGNNDHRKMIYLYEITDAKGFCMTTNILTTHTPAQSSQFTKDTIKKLVSSINVIGFVIGSSNFSKTSYLDPVKLGNKSNKDEADLFTYIPHYFTNQIVDTFLENNGEYPSVIFSNTSKKNKIPNTYLDKYLEQTLLGTLFI